MERSGYRNYTDVCQDCTLKNPQRSRQCKVPEFEWSQHYLDMDLSLRPVYCRHLSCKDGLEAARSIAWGVAGANRLIKWLVTRDLVLNTGDRIKASQFGTGEKPFDEVERYVTLNGEIITTDRQGNHYLSPQRVRMRQEKKP